MFDPFSTAARQTEKLLTAPIAVRTLATTGALDGCMDTRLHDLAMRPEDFPAGLEVVRFDDAGHFLHQEDPTRFNRILIDFLKR
jgi:pimeloyl-ACP methyl ester carboxylesterase